MLELDDAVGISPNAIANMHTTIWGDNVGALTLAKLELLHMTLDRNISVLSTIGLDLM